MNYKIILFSLSTGFEGKALSKINFIVCKISQTFTLNIYHLIPVAMLIHNYLLSNIKYSKDFLKDSFMGKAVFSFIIWFLVVCFCNSVLFKSEWWHIRDYEGVSTIIIHLSNIIGTKELPFTSC